MSYDYEMLDKSSGSRFENFVNSRLFSGILITIIVLLLGFISCFSYKYGWQWRDSDMSADIIHGKLLADENAFITSNWFYGNELRFIFQTIFFMPLFKLLGSYENWALVLSITIFLNNAVLILSCVFLMRQLKLKTNWILLSSLFLILPLTIEYWNIVTFGGSYILFIAQLFFFLGLYIRLRNQNGTTTAEIICYILYFAISFILGIEGIRSLIVIFIPLILMSVYLYFIEKNKHHFFLSLYGFACCCAGYLANMFLHSKYSFYEYEKVRIDDLSASLFTKLCKCVAGVMNFFGFSSGKPVISVYGFFSFFAFIGALLLIRAIIRTLKPSKLKTNYNFLWIFFSAATLFNFFVFTFSEPAVMPRFFIPFMVLCIPLTAVLFEYAENTFSPLKRIAVIYGITLFISGQACLNFRDLTVIDVNSARKPYLQYLLDNELEYGFATYWNANITTELSNGKVEVAGLDPRLRSGSNRNQLRIIDTLSPKKYFDPGYHSGEAFMLFTREEWGTVRSRLPAGTKPDFDDGNFIVIRYPSAEIIHSEIVDY